MGLAGDSRDYCGLSASYSANQCPYVRQRKAGSGVVAGHSKRKRKQEKWPVLPMRRDLERAKSLVAKNELQYQRFRMNQDVAFLGRDPTVFKNSRGNWRGPAYIVQGLTDEGVESGWETLAAFTRHELAQAFYYSDILHNMKIKKGQNSRKDNT